MFIDDVYKLDDLVEAMLEYDASKNKDNLIDKVKYIRSELEEGIEAIDDFIYAMESEDKFNHYKVKKLIDHMFQEFFDIHYVMEGGGFYGYSMGYDIDDIFERKAHEIDERYGFNVYRK